MFDWIIRGGKVIDGTGADPVCADIGVGSEGIEAVGDLSRAEAGKTIDASGCCVTPGFIDAHSHSDTYLLVEPSAPSKIYQGITTEIIGNCGASAAPIISKTQLPFDWQEMSYPGEWHSLREHLDLLRQCCPAVNVVPLVGHNRIRIGVMGYEPRPPSGEEMRSMVKKVEESLDQGAWGLSTGLIYRPGKCASAAEIAELARVVARRNGIYTTHMRSEGDRLLEALEEALAIGLKTGVTVEISHLKTSGSRNWPLLDAALDKLADARSRGVNAAADRYPYISGCTDLDVLLPDWMTDVDRETILKRLHAPAQVERFLRENSDRPDDYWKSVIVGTSTEKAWRGRSIHSIAAEMKASPPETVVAILKQDGLGTQAFFAGMNDDNMWKILAQPWVMIGTDASLRSTRGLLSADHPHPRAYGTFPKVLRAALDGRTVPLAEAVRKMTSLPAGHFGIRHRGKLAPGCRADIVVFDPSIVKDLATYENPHQFSRGISVVMVNGAVVLENGKLTGNRPGRVLSPG